MSSYKQLVTDKIYNFLSGCYLLGRTTYSKIFDKPVDHTIQTRKISLVALNHATKQVSRHDITVGIKDQYHSDDIHAYIQQSEVPMKAEDDEEKEEYFVEFEYNSAGKTYKYLTELPERPSTEEKEENEEEKAVVFPIYTKEEIQEFHTDFVPNGVMLSCVNDEHDVTDELHQHAGPKGNFYSDLEDYPGFKLEWVKVLDSVPEDLEMNPLTVEIMTYHGKTYVFSNESHISL